MKQKKKKKKKKTKQKNKTKQKELILASVHYLCPIMSIFLAQY